MIPFTPGEAKSIARSLRAALEPHATLSHGQALDVLARTVGLSDWNSLAAQYGRPALGPSVPVLRVYDSERARRFYVDWLGFAVDFEHRFEESMPLFTGISREQVSLGLSEHHGDGTPGSVVWVPTRGLKEFRQALLTSPVEQLRPGIDHEAPGGPTMAVTDPFGNELRFCEPVGT